MTQPGFKPGSPGSRVYTLSSFKSGLVLDKYDLFIKRTKANVGSRENGNEKQI